MCFIYLTNGQSIHQTAIKMFSEFKVNSQQLLSENVVFRHFIRNRERVYQGNTINCREMELGWLGFTDGFLAIEIIGFL